MKTFLVLVSLILSSSVFAQRIDPACNEFRHIQRTMRAIDSQSVDRVIPHADWLDKKYRRQDAISAGSTVARTVVLILLQRVNVFMYIFTPSRAEAATVTGSFVRSPHSYVRFLQLTPERACPLMRFGDSDSELLREITHEVYSELRRSSR
jgi:hypothetical protein